MAWEEIKGNTWEPTEGDVIIGVYQEKEEPEGSHSPLYHFNVKDKGIVSVWGCSMLNERLGQAKPGDVLRLTYNGMKETSKGQRRHDYKVERYKRDAPKDAFHDIPEEMMR